MRIEIYTKVWIPRLRLTLTNFRRWVVLLWRELMLDALSTPCINSQILSNIYSPPREVHKHLSRQPFCFSTRLSFFKSWVPWWDMDLNLPPHEEVEVPVNWGGSQTRLDVYGERDPARNRAIVEAQLKERVAQKALGQGPWRSLKNQSMSKSSLSIESGTQNWRMKSYQVWAISLK